MENVAGVVAMETYLFPLASKRARVNSQSNQIFAQPKFRRCSFDLFGSDLHVFVGSRTVGRTSAVCAKSHALLAKFKLPAQNGRDRSSGGFIPMAVLRRAWSLLGRPAFEFSQPPANEIVRTRTGLWADIPLTNNFP